MKLWLRFFLPLALPLFAATIVGGAPVLSPTGITVAATSAAPGDAITITIAAANGGAATPADDMAAGGTITGTVTFTHRVTGATISTGSVAFTTAATVAGAGGTGSFTRTFSIPTVTSQAGAYNASVTLSAASSGSASGSFSATSVLTVTGTPDLDLTDLTYPAGTAYRGGDVIAMTVSYTNRTSSNGANNVPYVSSTNSNASYFRIEVVLSSNPIFGDNDDFLLTYHDVSASSGAPLNANNASTTLSWNQVLPGNFAGSYYVLAKIDTQAGITETVENDLTDNGNNIYFTPDRTAARISLLPTNFPTMYWSSTNGNAYSDNPSVSSDGRYTAFASDSTNLGTNDTNGVRDIFLYDNQTSSVRKVSLSQQGAQTNAASQTPAISGNGTYVAFSSEATNLITSDTNGFSDIYVVNVLTGTLARVSVASDGTQANGSNFKPAISTTGRYIAFESTATNLISGGTTAGITHVYLHNRDVSNSGTFDTAGNISTVLVSQSTGGTQGNGNSIQASISGGGQYVAFASDASNLGGTVGASIRNIYLRNVTGATTTLVTVDTGSGAADGSSRAPALNQNNGSADDGRYLAFGSEATDLVAGDTNAVSDIFVYNQVGGSITRVSLSSANAEATDPSATAAQRLGSINPSISATGRYVAFASLANNLTAGDSVGQSSATDANGSLDVFVRDRDVNGSGTFDTGGNVATTLVSKNRFGLQSVGVLGTNPTTPASDVYPVISGNGRWVAFPSDTENTGGMVHGANNRSSPDSNTFRDVFLHDRRINALPSSTTPPSVSITSPVTGTTYPVNTALTLVGSASASAGTIASVQFFVNGTSLGTDTTFPYNATWTPTATGSFALSALVTDSFGNQAVSTNVNVTISAVSPTSPTVSVSSPAAGASLFANNPATISATASDTDGTIANVAFYANNVLIGTDTAFPYSISFTPTATGSYTLTAVATDNGGNQTTSSGVSVSVTNLAAPSISITSPTPVQINSATSITATATSSGSVASVQFLANGTSLGTITTAPFTFSWTPTAAGTYTLTAVATDNLGSQTTSAGISVVVSAGSSPTVSISSPTTGSTVNVGAAQTVAATATDSDGTVSSVAFTVNGIALGTDTTFPYTASWTPVTTGSYTLLAVATDNLGNQTTSSSVSITVTSGTAPTVSIASPAAGAAIANGSTNTISATATANSGTIASVQFYANGVSLGTDTTFPYTISFTPVANGSYSLAAVATDSLGNQTTSSAVGVTVAANSAPTVTVTAPANGATVGVGSSNSVTATATDTDGTIASVQFFANSVSLGTDTTSPYSITWTPTVAGSYAITAVALDDLGSSTTSSSNTVTVTGGNQPSISISSPAASASLAVNASTDITATATAVTGTIASVQFLANGTSLGTDTTFPYALAWTPTANGTYSLTAVAIDTAGNQATSSAVSVTVAANQSPAFTSLTPANGSTVGVGSSNTVTAVVTDADGTIASVQFLANGAALGTDASSPYTVTWVPTIAGSYSLTAVVTDNLGASTTSSTNTITVTGGNAPTVSVTAPANASSIAVNSSTSVTATATATTGTIASVQFLANGTAIGTDATFPYSATFSPTATGTYSLTALATDTSGNQATSAAVSVTVAANASPSVSITAPATGATVGVGSSNTLSATAADSDGSVASVQFLVNGAALSTDTTAPYTATWKPTVAGSYSLTAVATDDLGATTTSTTVSVTVSGGNEPSVSISSPSAGASIAVGSTNTVTATATAVTGTIASVQFFANGVSLGTDTAVPYTATFLPTANGTYSLTAVALDTAGNQATSTAVSVTVANNQSPTVGITAPAGGATVGVGSSTVVNATATDADGTIASVQFFANGTSIGTNLTSPYGVSWKPTVAGSYSLTTVATDNMGATTTSATVSVTVSGGNAPTVAISSPATGATLAVNSSATVTATATAATGTIASVQFLANGVSLGTDTTFPYTATFSPTANGSYALTALAVDTAGNQATSSSVTVTVAANQSPTVSIGAPAAGATVGIGTATTVSATAADADGTVASVQFLANGVSLGTVTTSPYSVSWTPTVPGSYNLTAVATDNLGATTTSTTVAVTASGGNAPTISITAPATGSSVAVTSTNTITASAAATTGTIARVEFFANGASLGTDTTFPYTATWTPAANGTISLTAVATDTAGNQATSSAVSVTVAANQSPATAITSPAAGATVGVGVATTITANASDADGTIASVQFRANGSVISTATTSPYTATWTPNVAGTYSLTTVATDNLGATTTSAAVSVTVSGGNAPTISISSPATGSTVLVNSAQTIVASATAATGTIASVEFLDNGTSLLVDTSYPYNAAWTPTATGTHVLTAVATDTAGNKATSSAVTITVATLSSTFPTISITSPAGGASVKVGVATTIAATAADSDGTITSVEFFANGVSLGVDTADPYTASLVALSAGNYVLTAVATDNAGNRTTSATVTVAASNVGAPSVSFSSPTSGDTYTVGSAISLSVSTSLGSGVISGVQFLANGVSIGTTTTSLTGQGSIPFFNISWTPAAAGTYVFTAVAADAVGNQTTSAPITVTVTNIAAPTVAVSSPAAGASLAVNTTHALTATASSAAGSIGQVEFFVNGASVGVDTTFPYAGSWTPTSPGTYALRAVARDNLGNQTTSTAVSVSVVSGTAPTVSVTAPAAAAKVSVNNVTTLTATATASTGTIASVQFFANGVSLGTDPTFPYTASWTPQALGSYALTALATDTVGNQTTSSSVAVTVIDPTAAPTVNLTSPTAGATVSGATTITATATPVGAATITNVEFFADGVSVGVDATAPYSVSWTPSTTGTISLTAVATDSNGIQATSSAISVRTGTPPTVVVTPLAGSVLVNSSQTLAATATSTVGTISSVQFFVNGVALGAADTVFPYTAVWTPTAVGSFSLTAVAIDTLGNNSTSAVVTAVVTGGTVPTVSVTGPANNSFVAVGASTTVTANAAATTTGATIASVQFLANGVAIGAADTTFPYSVAWTPTVSGTISLTAVATDTAGNFATSSAVSVTSGANQAPTVSVNAPATLGVGVQTTLTVTASDADGSVASVQYFANGTAIGAPVTTGPTFSINFTSALAGNIAITARAVDNLGLATTSATATIVVSGGNAPTVAITAPATGSTVPVNLAQSVTATATAAVGSIASVEFRVVSGGTTTSLGTDATFPYAASWTPTSVGSYTLTATATDTSGNQAVTSSAITVTATSNTGPSINIISPINAATFTGGRPIVLLANASDSNGTISSVRFLVNGEVVGGSLTSAPYTTTWTPAAPAANTVYTLTAIAVDNDFNATTSSAIGVTIAPPSGVPPTVTITSPVAGTLLTTNSTVPIVAGVSSSAVTQVEFFDNGVSLGTDNTAPFSLAWSPVAPGAHRIVAVATGGGNIVSSTPVDLNVTAATSADKPTVTIVSPTDGSSVGIGTTPAATVTLTADARDNDGTIAKVEFFINGTSVGADLDFPYSLAYTPTSIGRYVVTAVATDNAGNVNASAAVTFTTTQANAPVVTITTPAANASIPVNVAQQLAATAVAASGRAIVSVQFLANGTPIATDTTFPYSINWTPTSPGSYSLTAVAVDDASVSGSSAAVAVTVTPGSPPTATLTSPAAGSNLTVGSPTALSATATAVAPATIASVEFFVNGVSQGVDTTFPYSVAYTPSATGNNISITVRATDSLGNTFTTSATLINVVSAPGPSVTLTSPTSGASVTVGTPTAVTAAVTPQPSTTVASVQFFANGVSIGTIVSAPYTVNWLPTAGGNFVLTARATDSAGTSTTSTAVTVNVTTPPASIAITSPSGGAVLPVNTPQTITASATTSSGTVSKVDFFVNGVSLSSATAFPFTAAWTPKTPGIFALTARATDNFGTITDSAVITVTVATGNVPTVAISTPLTSATLIAGTAQAVVVNASAANGTIRDVELFANNVSIGVDTVFPYNFSWTPGGLGAVALTAVATDSQGNRAVSFPVNVTIAGISPGAPTVVLTAPAAGASLPVGVATLVSAAATDADGTITKVEFFNNGVSIGVDEVFPYNVQFTPGATGSYVLTARATDNGGNVVTSVAVNVTVSGGTAPSVAIEAPLGGQILGVNLPQTIKATATSSTGFIASVQFFLNGVPLATDTSFPYATSWTPGAVGAYTITARATDNLGNITDSAVIAVSVAASAPPTIAITNPATGSSYTVGTPLTVAANAADSDGSITDVQFFVNGVPLGGLDTVSPYSTVWTANSVGIYALTAQATDNNGNVTTSAPITVTIGANALPTIALTSPAAGSYSLGNLILVAANANDSDGSVASVQFFANGLAIGTATAAPFNLSWRPTLAGTFALTAQATDNVGNVAMAGPVNVTVTSTAAPAVTITNPVAGTQYGVGNAIPFAATPSGGNGPIAQVQFFVNGASLGTADTVSPYSATWTPNAPGSYSLLAIATDSAGLSSSSSATLSITISGNGAPLVALTGPPSGTSVNGGATVNLSAVASDADGTIASVRFIANGNIVGTATALPYGASWVPSAAGTYTVTAQATDNSGNVTNSAPITVTVVANRAPTVALTSPGNGSTVQVGGSANLTATAGDTDGTIASVQFFANGQAVGAADTTAPYAVTWTPGAEGIYRVTALALDNSGATTVSGEITVLAIIPGTKGADTIYSGNYLGLAESGRFAAISVRGTNATFIGYSTTSPSRVYFFSGLPVDPAGGFAEYDTVGRALISGTATETGATGTLDAGRVTFIGTVGFGAGTGIASGYYTGGLSGKPDSTLIAIVGVTGSITLYAADGSFRDAGSGTLSAAGAFSLTTQSGVRFAGRADPATGFLTGSITGGPGGDFMAALSSGVSFSDGFLKNLSTRGQVGSGGNILIAGFVVAGDSPKQVLIRAIGPSLTDFGVTGALADPQLQLFSGNTQTTANDNWGGVAAISSAANRVGAFALAPTSRDAVILATLAPGSYTAQVSGVGGATGVALVELYDVDELRPFSGQKVTNVATRGVVGSGQAQLIAGFVVSGNTSKKVLIRAVGPTLGRAPFNVGGVLADPQLRLLQGADKIVRDNDNWEMGNDPALINEASAKVGAFPLATGARDAAILINLPPGAYSAQVTGPGTTTGVALVEVYEVP